MDFLFDLELGSARLIGAMTRARVVQVPERARLFGVRFRPGGLVGYLKASAAELVDASVALSDVANGAGELMERVAVAGSRTERERVVADFLTGTRARTRPVDPRVARATGLIGGRLGRVTSRQVSRDVCLGERQLERLFRDHVGVSPKHYARIVRMQHALELCAARGVLREARGTGVSTRARARQADLAVTAGYADESHLLRDFRALAGAGPRALMLEIQRGFVLPDGMSDSYKPGVPSLP